MHTVPLKRYVRDKVFFVFKNNILTVTKAALIDQMTGKIEYWEYYYNLNNRFNIFYT